MLLEEPSFWLCSSTAGSGWQPEHSVTLPLLAPVLGFLVARDLVTSLQVTLVPTLLLTNGGPLNATRTLPFFVYEQGFFELRLGDPAAAAKARLLTRAA